ncbi:MAG TPA: VIT1/CCC1 transporter family protein [Jatrophihabitantaceae bacterium]|jgi:VIT1/CCC1 family predicted Fe2+/Mn2+ transporter|nr:VIT1/CCC1 transporter family protein [Jatrophihabitantaceae bacterium]
MHPPGEEVVEPMDVQPEKLDHFGGEHGGVAGGGWLRPAVFGVMDGLVTNVSLIAGVGGGHGSRHTIVLTGLAGLVAGAFSMATGEYASVSSQNHAIGAEVAIEARELRVNSEVEAQELAAHWVERGISAETAIAFATELAEHPDEALRVHIQQELGVDPHELPSPWAASSSSFVFFAVGAILPLLPYLFGYASLPTAIGIGAVGLLVAGFAVARFTRRPPLRSGLRQLALGVLAIGITYLVGRLIGASSL